MLLHLPPELIQLVLQHCSTPAFVEASFSCRALYEIASNCREPILHHLRQTPGLEPDFQLLTSKQLFRLLIQRAFQQLYGAQFHADCTTFKFDSHIIDVKASSFSKSDNTIIALTKRGHDTVSLFRVHEGNLRCITHLQPFRPQPGVVEVLRTTFDNANGVYVLQRFTPIVDGNGPGAGHPFVRQAFQTSPRGEIYLVRYPIQAPNDPIQVCNFPDHTEFEPLALAATQGDTFAISWQHVREENETEVVLYNAQAQSSSNDMPGVTGLFVHFFPALMI
ncbi:hypothetical protein FE257_002164 [Aspergillus nanangensis]|uniref:F-box domain-containing protein n=1 Tax=Aspergillus nanangensis TaxID=2582783 RepID=A0AAD4CTW1_ASPNN|nr:hypothetical protein FE257_002164 [Aspergillus nanangensis]